MNQKNQNNQNVNSENMNAVPVKKNKNVRVWQEGAAVKITTGELGGAVAREGFVASLGGAGMTPDELEREMRIAREISPDGEIGVNLMYVAKDFHSLARVVKKLNANFIVLSAGYDSKILNFAGEYEDLKGLEIIPKVAHPSLALRVLQSGVVKRIMLEGAGCGGHIGFSSIKNFVSTEDLVKQTFIRFATHLAKQVLGKGAPEKEVEAFIEDIRKHREDYRVKYHVPELIAAGGINEDNFQQIIDSGADHIANCLIFTICKESNAHVNWKTMQFQADRRIIFESPVKGMLGSAIKNDFIEKYFELDETGVYRFKATEKNRPQGGEKIKPPFVDYCATKCMEHDFCLKYSKDYLHPMCIFHRLEETALAGNVGDGIVFTSENLNYIQKVARVNITAKEVIDHIKKYTYGAC